MFRKRRFLASRPLDGAAYGPMRYETPDMGVAYFPHHAEPLTFRRPAEVLIAWSPGEVSEILARAERAVAAGRWVAGYMAYEAAPAFDPALAAHAPREGLPLAWFGVYNGPDPAIPEARATAYRLGAWEPLVSEEAYRAAFAAIRERIAAGDTYQVNYTFPMRAPFMGAPFAWFEALCAAQCADFSAYLDTGRFQVLSVSPELFFELEGDRLTTRPMKGTRPRGRWCEEDMRLARELRASEKEQAENVMIVDLLRNDMGRVSAPGSVQVDRLFEVERYETVWQMTSTITSRTGASVPEIFAALFPCGSVTGAPKIETSRIIHNLEPYPRGVYCGAVGWWGPGHRARFNVAIRTAVTDVARGEAYYHVGSGVTWDSAAGAEYQECLQKARVLDTARPDFALLETLLWDGVFHLLDGHLQRLRDSAAYFDFPCDEADVRDALAKCVHGVAGPSRVRLTLPRAGAARAEAQPLPPPRRFRVGWAACAVDSGEVFLYHKTTHHAAYEAARAARPDCDDVILFNARGEITESTIANIVIEAEGGRLLTPALDCGLLPGVMRADLIAQGKIAEACLLREDLARARRFWLINSVRGWIETEWAG